MKTKHTKRNLGIILVIFELVAIYGCTLEGNKFPNSIIEWFGFLIYGIIGILLIIDDYRK